MSGAFFTRWVLANLSGWIFGIIFILALGVLGDLIHFTGSVYLGLGMGFTIGLWQWRVIDKRLHVGKQ